MTRIHAYYRLGILALCLLTFALRLHLLEDIFWHDDEAKSQRLYVQQPAINIFTHYTANNHWLASSLGHGMSYIGDQRFILRWPSILWGTLAVPLLSVMSIRLFGQRREGFIAALLLSLSAFHIQWSQQFRGYSALLFFGLLAFYFFCRALSTGRKRDWSSFVAGTILMLASHLFAVLMLLTFLVILAGWIGRHRVRMRKELKQASWLFILIMSLLGVSVYFTWFAKVRIIDYYHALPEVSLFQLLIYQIRAITPTLESINSLYREIFLAFTTHKNPQMAFLLFWGPVFGGAALSRPTFSRPALLLGLWLVIPLFLVTLAEFTVPGFFASDRYMIFILPAWLLWVSRCLAAGSERLLVFWLGAGRARTSLLWGLQALLIAYLSWLNWSVTRSYFVDRAGHDWRNLAAYLAGQVRSNDLIICKQLPHVWPPSRLTSQDRCAKELERRLLEQGRQLRFPIVPLETATALSTWFRFKEEGQLSGTVWLVLWGERESWQHSALETLTMLTPLERQPESRTIQALVFERLGKTVLLEVDDTATLSGNLGEAASHLARLDLASQDRFDYYLYQAQTLAYEARINEAQIALNMAHVLAPERREAQNHLKKTSQMISANFLQKERAPIHSLQLDFGQPPLLRLAGYTLPSPLKAGQTTLMTTFWRVLKPISTDYTIFLHLRDQTGQVVAQLDFQPFEGLYPTSQWQSGSTVTESRPWKLPPDLRPGFYTLHLGLYRLDPLKHLLPVHPAGQEPTILLGKIKIE